MIDTITVLLDRFDLTGFLGAYRTFYEEWAGAAADPDDSVVVLKQHGDTPMPLLGNRNLPDELLRRSWLLFFPVHEPLAADTALCVDGVRKLAEQFDIGEADAYGFLVEVHDGQISLHPALYDGSSGSMPSLDLQGRCSVLDACMAEFARRFVT